MEIDEDENITNLLNLFMIYYKRKNNINDGTAMFDHIERNQIMIQTNQMLEEFYEVLQEYKTSRYKDPISYDEKIIKDNEDLDLFVLTIDDINEKISDSLLALLIDIHNSYLDKNWNII
jgi:hypothetical protein